MKTLTAILLMNLIVSIIYAEVPSTEKSKDESKISDGINIRARDMDDFEPTLTIPKSLVKELYAQIEAEEKGNSVKSSSSNFPQKSTIIGGLFLSLAFIFGGVLLFKNKSSKIATFLILLSFGAVSATVIYANIAPPAYTSIDSRIFNEKMKKSYRGAVGKVKVEIEDGSFIYLTIPIKEENKKKSNEEE